MSYVESLCTYVLMSKTIKRFFASLWMTNSRNLSFFGQALNNTSERSEESQYRAIGTVSYLRYLSAPPAFDHPSTVEEFPSKLCQENNYHAKEFIKQPVTEVLSPVLGSVEIYCGLAFVGSPAKVGGLAFVRVGFYSNSQP